MDLHGLAYYSHRDDKIRFFMDPTTYVGTWYANLKTTLCTNIIQCATTLK